MCRIFAEFIQSALASPICYTRTMFDIGWPELLLILIVALVLFGPNRLPELARSIGKSVHAFKQGLREGMTEEETKKEETKEEVKH